MFIIGLTGSLGMGKAAGTTFIGYESCKRAFDQGYRFINIGNLASQGTIGLSADLKRLRQLAERPT